jgi:hypothetical protein
VTGAGRAAVDWAALRAYARSIGAARATREDAAEPGSLVVGVRQVGWYRAAASQLAERLGPDRAGSANCPAADGAGRWLAAAAFGGLQDSAPRAGLLGLHARAAGVGPDGWEHPALAQVWLRRADHLVPRRDVGVFTLGALPRDAAQAAAIGALAERAVAACGGRPRSTREVAAALGPRGADVVRFVGVSGRVLLRWDASSIDLIPIEPPPVDPEDARRELARRYLTWHGPANHRQFARWSGVSAAEATRTFTALRPELVPVSLDGRARWLLAADEAALREAARPVGVRLLPPGDPYLQADLPLLVEAAPTGAGEPGIADRTSDSRLRNSLTGRVLLDGDLCGAWGRRGTDVTLALWDDRPATDTTTRVEAEAATLETPLAAPPEIHWLA